MGVSVALCNNSSCSIPPISDGGLISVSFISNTHGRIVVSAFGRTLSADFTTASWQNGFRHGAQFVKEMSVAANVPRFVDMWLPANLQRTQTVHQSTMTFRETFILRHSTGTTQSSLDRHSRITEIPLLDGPPPMPTPQQMRRDHSIASAIDNFFSIDCRPNNTN